MKLRTSWFALASLVAFAPLAHADKIYLKSTGKQPEVAQQAPDFIEGKVLSEKDGQVTIRVEGGTIVIARASIDRIEKDGLTEQQIASREDDMRKRLADADQKRGTMLAQWADASAKRAEASAAERAREPLEVVVDFQGVIPTQLFRFYEPIIGRIDMDGLGRAIENYLRAEVRRLSRERR